jgi:opacity protein-like surface antigen
MKKLIIAFSTCAASLVAPQVFAQSANFQGLSAGFGLNIADTTTENIGGGFSKSGSDTDSNVFLQLQYNAALNEHIVLGFGGTIDMGDLKAGKLGTSQSKEKDTYSLYVAPGYAFNSNWLGYGKIAYLNSRVSNDTLGSANFEDGFGYGVGLQMLFNKHWFGQVEYLHHQYGDRTPSMGNTLKLQSNVYSLAAGYKF